MKLNINLKDIAVPVTESLVTVINKQINAYCNDTKNNWDSDNINTTYAIVLCFRDKSYSAELGGFHPIEIGLVPDANTNSDDCLWVFDYITDFAWCGGAFPELVKELDFNFTGNCFEMAFAGRFPLNNKDTRPFYTIWESNFISYLEMEVFNEIEVTIYHD